LLHDPKPLDFPLLDRKFNMSGFGTFAPCWAAVRHV
jgi:hypothetical protein